METRAQFQNTHTCIYGHAGLATKARTHDEVEKFECTVKIHEANCDEVKKKKQFSRFISAINQS